MLSPFFLYYTDFARLYPQLTSTMHPWTPFSAMHLCTLYVFVAWHNHGCHALSFLSLHTALSSLKSLILYDNKFASLFFCCCCCCCIQITLWVCYNLVFIKHCWLMLINARQRVNIDVHEIEAPPPPSPPVQLMWPGIGQKPSCTVGNFAITSRPFFLGDEVHWLFKSQFIVSLQLKSSAFWLKLGRITPRTWSLKYACTVTPSSLCGPAARAN